MASTNKTSNLQLSQFIATDTPTWLVDYNGDMEKIDAGVGRVEELAQTASTQAVGVANGLQTTNQNVTTLSGQVANVQNQANSNTASVNGINQRLGNTDINGIGDGTVTGAINALNAGGSSGGAKRTLLWENKTGFENFPAQTITLASSDYDELEIFSVISNATGIVCFNKTDNTSHSAVIGDAFVSAGSKYLGSRQVTFNSRVSLQISTGSEINGDTFNTKDTIVIPKNIYGIKY